MKILSFFFLFICFLLASSIFSTEAQQIQISSASTTLLFQLQVKSIPKVKYSDFYGPTATVSSFCNWFGGLLSMDGDVNSFEAIRRDIATAAGIPENWVTIFPSDGVIGSFLVSTKNGFMATTAVATGSSTSSTTTSTSTTSSTTTTSTTTTSTTTTMPNSTTTTTTSTIVNQSSTEANNNYNTSTSSPQNVTTSTTSSSAQTSTAAAPSTTTTSAPSFAQDNNFVQIHAVWVVLKMTNESNPIPTQARESANQELIRISTNIGYSGPLANLAAASTGSLSDGSFFAFNAVDFGYEVSTSPMRSQKDQKAEHWLKVYNDEWNRFFIGMIAVTILGTAAYITAHCFIHRVQPRGALVSASRADEDENDMNNGKSAVSFEDKIQQDHE
jgi:hypothetical protein